MKHYGNVIMYLISMYNPFRIFLAMTTFLVTGALSSCNHADELETSVMMHYHPELVNLEEAGEGRYKPFAIKSLQEKVAWIPRDWQKVSDDTGIGNPKLATAEKGKRYAEAVAEKYAKLFSELVREAVY